jgi:flagellar hook-associated protein 2
MAVSGPASATTGTNIDVNGIVGKLMAVEQKPLTALNTKEGSAQSKISAFGQVKGALSAFQTALQGLSSANKFQANIATSSDPSVFTATAMTSASVGSHSINVVSLAQSQRLATSGMASSTAPIGSGTLTFDFGTVTGDKFKPNAGKYRETELNNATISNGTTAATPGATIAVTETTTFAPDANSSGTIPAGTLTINGVKVGKIDLEDADSPLYRARNIAEAFDDAYVESGGNSGTFTAENGKVMMTSESGGKRVVFGIAGKAADPATAAKNAAALAAKLGLSAAQLGTQEFNSSNSKVTVESTVGLNVGDSIKGGGFSPGTTIAAITDATHFVASAAGKDNTDDDPVSLKASTVSSSKGVLIDPSNNSLQGIRDAINSAKIGVTASIVNDGSTNPNRLILSSDAVGAGNNLKITVNGDPELVSLLGHDPAGAQRISEITPGSDASLVVDGIPVSKTSNTVNDVIQGVTLNLLGTSEEPVKLDVARDTGAVKTSVEEFVKAYNDLKKIVADLTAYNPATKKGAALQGDSAMRSLDAQIDVILSTPLGTPAGSLTSLSQIGVSKQTNGSLAIDANKLNAAIDTKFNDVAGLFAAIGKATDSLVNYKSNSPATVPGNYAVTVTTLASQGKAIGNVNLSSGSTTIGAGTTLSATVDGVSASVPLTAGTFNGMQLANMVQSAINATGTFASQGKTVTATIDGNGRLNVKSNTYGSTSAVSLVGAAGTPLADFMGLPVSTAGVNVTGTIDGAPATGQGQLLTSATGKSNGLQIQIAGGQLGDRGTVNYTQGYAHKLNDFANAALGNTGVLTGRLDGLSASVKSIAKERDTINSRLVSIEERYRRQYTKLDATLSNMNTTSTYLSQQLAKM